MMLGINSDYGEEDLSEELEEFIQDLVKRYLKQKDDCKQCVIDEQAKQIIAKDKLISFLIKTIVGLVTALIGAGVYNLIGGK